MEHDIPLPFTRWPRPSRWSRLALATLLAAVPFSLSTCAPRLPLLDLIQARGSLRVASTNSPTTCYRGPSSPLGFQCEILQKFATELGVDLEVVYVRNQAAAIHAVLDDRADLAAGIIKDTTGSDPLVLSPPVQRVTQQLVYASAPRPAKLDGIDAGLEVVADSAADAALIEASRDAPTLTWASTRALGSEDLLYRVAQGHLAYTIADSDLVALNQRFYPQLKTALTLSPLQSVVWGIRRSPDHSLSAAMNAFFEHFGAYRIAKLHDAYFNRRNPLGHVDITQFKADAKQVLPTYEPSFQAAADANGLDWRMLAAIAYQESHWDAGAVSPTGVKGLMQLTHPTAKFVQVASREDPHEAIGGGARYLAHLRDRIPASVPEPDRSWMALAAWNMGLGHLLDARRITRQRHGNPNAWADVRKALPLLTQEEWFQRARYGYADGNQALGFVNNVQAYYDILVWLTAGESHLAKAPMVQAVHHPARSGRSEETRLVVESDSLHATAP